MVTGTESLETLLCANCELVATPQVGRAFRGLRFADMLMRAPQDGGLWLEAHNAFFMTASTARNVREADAFVSKFINFEHNFVTPVARPHRVAKPTKMHADLQKGKDFEPTLRIVVKHLLQEHVPDVILHACGEAASGRHSPCSVVTPSFTPFVLTAQAHSYSSIMTWRLDHQTGCSSWLANTKELCCKVCHSDFYFVS
jgi:hypothetical protein